MIDHKDRPAFYDKPKVKMTKYEHGIYWTVAGFIFILMCSIFLLLDARFQ